jgi:hypothetical protein
VPVFRLEIAHIRAENEGGPRYDKGYGDPDVFDNLLRMCNMHHKMIDKIEPDRHPADRLEGWKRDREADGLGASSDIAV